MFETATGASTNLPGLANITNSANELKNQTLKQRHIGENSLKRDQLHLKFVSIIT